MSSDESLEYVRMITATVIEFYWLTDDMETCECMLEQLEAERIVEKSKQKEGKGDD